MRLKAVRLALTVIGSLALGWAEVSGEDSFHTAANRRHNRWEGPTERLHSLSDLALVGFTAFREPKSWPRRVESKRRSPR